MTTTTPAPATRTVHHRTIQRIALRIVRDHRARVDEYEQECDEAAREGYRPHYCIHGANLWVEYDVICPGCEDGAFARWTAGAELYGQALELAKHQHAQFTRQNDALVEAIGVLRKSGLHDEAELLTTRATDRFVAELSRLLDGARR